MVYTLIIIEQHSTIHLHSDEKARLFCIWSTVKNTCITYERGIKVGTGPTVIFAKKSMTGISYIWSLYTPFHLEFRVFIERWCAGTKTSIRRTNCKKKLDVNKSGKHRETSQTVLWGGVYKIPDPRCFLVVNDKGSDLRITTFQYQSRVGFDLIQGDCEEFSALFGGAIAPDTVLSPVLLCDSQKTWWCNQTALDRKSVV